MLRIEIAAANVVELRFGPDGESLYSLAREPGGMFRSHYVPRVWRIDCRSSRIADEWRLPTTFAATLSADLRSIYHFCYDGDVDVGEELVRRELATNHLTKFVEQSGAWILQIAVSPNENLVTWGNLPANGSPGFLSSCSRLPDGDSSHHITDTLAHCLAYSQDGALLASGAPSSGLSIWRSEERVQHYAEPASHLAWSAGGQLAWGMSRRIAVARPTTDEPVRTWRSRTGPLRALGFSASGRLLVTGTGQGTCHYHDAQAGCELASFDWGIGPIHSVAFSPDGLTCAAGGEKGQIVVWDVEE